MRMTKKSGATSKRDFEKELREIQLSREYEKQIIEIRTFPLKEAEYCDLKPPLPAALVKNLSMLGIDHLYSHQAEAVRIVREGGNAALVTETSSGKSLCYNLPVVEHIMGDPRARALYLFPTKALGQDQSRALYQLIAPGAAYDEQKAMHAPKIEGCGAIRFGTYDGDTDKTARSAIRSTANIIMTNPDMLSLGILPNHARYWSAFFRNLKFVVLDEIHIYRGVFGSHVANVMRRLLRICESAGARPQFICCSATIGNPAEHAETLTGCPMTTVDQSGAPHAARRFVLWNPPIFDEVTGLRRSPITESVDLFSRFVSKGYRTIVFGRSRPSVEVILRFARDRLRESPERLEERIMSYRGGYMPSDRREIERQLSEGELLGVACTNALELGVDIGSLDVAVLNGYPGTIASVWQQAGRAGRRESESLGVFVAGREPLDQYFMRHPEYLFERPVEHAIINPNNPYILKMHLKAAAVERPLQREEEKLFGENFVGIVREFLRTGEMKERTAGVTWAGMDFPAASINLRTATSTRYTIWERSGAQLGLMDASTAFNYLHDGAVYLHQGETYLVEALDLARHTATVRRSAPPYYTRSLSREEIAIDASQRKKKLHGFPVHFGMVDVTSRIYAYKKIRQNDDAVIEQVSLELPEENLHTQALWFILPEDLMQQVAAEGMDPMGGLHALEHAAIAMLPFLAMCDRQDIGGVSDIRHHDTGLPTVLIHDGVDGGIGLSEVGYEQIETLLRRTFELVKDCPCSGGCPGCIQSPKCGNMNEPLDKDAALIFLAALLHIAKPKLTKKKLHKKKSAWD